MLNPEFIKVIEGHTGMTIAKLRELSVDEFRRGLAGGGSVLLRGGRVITREKARNKMENELNRILLSRWERFINWLRKLLTVGEKSYEKV